MGKTLIDKRYELRGMVGSGGMANVFLAHDEVLDSAAPLKLLKDHYAANEEFVERFKREAQSAASLSHRHIVPVFDAGETGDGLYYIAMEYLPGGTLKDRIMSKGPLPVRTAAAAALQIAEALQAAHEQGMIHRDIKPHNILVTDSGHVKVADFGIARAAEATTISDLGEILGSVKYMSPEQAMGEPVGPASDLYSLGVVLYEMLTGKVPFEADSRAGVPVKHVDERPRPLREVNPDVPEAMEALVLRLLAERPEDRYGSAAELIGELERVREGLSPASAPAGEGTTAPLKTPPGTTLPAPGAPGPRRRRISWALAALVALVALLVAVGGAVGWSMWRDHGGDSAPREEPPAAGGEAPGPQ